MLDDKKTKAKDVKSLAFSLLPLSFSHILIFPKLLFVIYDRFFDTF